jgi:hypothetical protein
MGGLQSGVRSGIPFSRRHNASWSDCVTSSVGWKSWLRRCDRRHWQQRVRLNLNLGEIGEKPITFEYFEIELQINFLNFCKYSSVEISPNASGSSANARRSA